MKFDRDKFFGGVHEHIDSSLEQAQVEGFNFLLDHFEAEPLWASIPLIAYGFATPYHETAGSMQPVEEGYYLARYGQARVKSFQKSLRYFPYFGRGFVQLTWETKRIPNYSKATTQISEQMPELVTEFESRTGKTFDLVKHPEQALDPLIAFAVMTLGMFQGWFTSHKITDFIHGSTKNYVDARTVINGHDKAALIAGYAKTFEAILRAALIDPAAAIPQPDESAIPTAGSTSGDQAKSAEGTQQPGNIDDSGVPAKVEDPVTVQTVAAEPAKGENSVDATINTWSARFMAIPGAILAAAGTFFAWLKDSPAHVITTFAIVFGSIILVYTLSKHVVTIIREGRDAKEKARRETQAHEIQLALIASAASKEKNTVVLETAPPPATEIPSSDAPAEDK